MKTSARAVVIGGGVGGASVLYRLARLGWEDVVLCERADLTSGSTFHSAGLVGQLRSTLSLTKMMMNSVELYRTLESEVGLETGWHEVGSLRLASSKSACRSSRARPAGRRRAARARGGRGSRASLSADVDPRRARRGVPRPTGTSIRASSRSRLPKRAQARRGDLHVDARHRHRRGGRSRARRADGQGRDRDRRGRQRGRHVRRRDRPAGRRERPNHPDGARVPRHTAGRRATRRADDARSVAARVLPRRVGRARDGRVRASSRALGPRRDPGGLQQQAAAGGLGAVRRAS